jgi:hypothetical protein
VKDPVLPTTLCTRKIASATLLQLLLYQHVHHALLKAVFSYGAVLSKAGY